MKRSILMQLFILIAGLLMTGISAYAAGACEDQQALDRARDTFIQLRAEWFADPRGDDRALRAAAKEYLRLSEICDRQRHSDEVNPGYRKIDDGGVWMDSEQSAPVPTRSADMQMSPCADAANRQDHERQLQALKEKFEAEARRRDAEIQALRARLAAIEKRLTNE